MKNGFFTVDNQSMTRIVTALIAHHIFSPFSQQVDNFALAFVTPLSAKYDDVLTHLNNHPIDVKKRVYHPNPRLSVLLACRWLKNYRFVRQLSASKYHRPAKSKRPTRGLLAMRQFDCIGLGFGGLVRRFHITEEIVVRTQHHDVVAAVKALSVSL